VTLFFVISGFVLSLPFLRASVTADRVSVRRYLVRRLRRIEPPYVVSLAVFLLADIVFLRDSLRSLLPHFLAGLGYAHGLVFNARNPINSVTWSLEVEAQFYLVMPLIASLFSLAAGRRRALVLSLGALSLMSLAGPLGASLRWTQSLGGCLAAFAIGIVIADLYLNEGWAGGAGSRTGDAAFGVGLGFFMMLPVISTGLAYGYGQLLASGLLVVGALRGSSTRLILRRPGVWIVGGMCYSIYLVHLQVIRLLWRPMQHVAYLGEWGFHKTLLVHVLVMACAVMLVSTAFFLLVELPCMRWSRQGSRHVSWSAGLSRPVAAGAQGAGPR
jgi:peptidoglycan/LPS O-acetylase OafA/YrhL